MINNEKTPICLLTACKRRKFKLFGDSSKVCALDYWITCCYWSASRSNRLRALKAYSSWFKCCEKVYPNYIKGKHRGSWVWGISSIICVITDREQHQGRKVTHWQVQKVTLAGPKSHTRAKMPQWSVIIKGLRPVLEGFVVTMHSPSGFDVLFAQARVHCDNKPRQIGLNHDYNMTF